MSTTRIKLFQASDKTTVFEGGSK